MISLLIKYLGLPINASAEGGPVDLLIVLVHIIMGVLFVTWTAFFLYTIFRFRRSKHPAANYQGSKTLVPFYLVTIIAIVEITLEAAVSSPFWHKKVNAPQHDSSAMHVRVIAQQFAWNIQYPGPDGIFGKTEIKLVSDDNPIGLNRNDPAGKDDVLTINQLHLPVNKPVILEITTKDVIHSFSLPYFRVKQDTIPGMSISVLFTPNQTSAQIREGMIETIKLPSKRNLDLYVPMDDLKDKDGNIIAKKGRSLSAATAGKLIQAGITEVKIAPATPCEIACAQLCGLNHFKMKGYLTVETEEEFKKWYAEAVEEAQAE